MEFVIVAVLMGGLGGVLAITLTLANRAFHVEVDGRIEEVELLLPSTNCGACGHPGCRAFAEATVSGSVSPGKCTVSSAAAIETIATYLGVDVGAEEKRVARLACAGGNHVSRTRARYDGLMTCRAAALVSGGGKGCAWGCLGLADCEDVCTFGAITMDKYGLPVVDMELCTACNDCVVVCPKDLFSLQPVSHRLWVACKNLEKGDDVEAECGVACTACARCAVDAPQDLVTMIANLPVVDYTKNQLATPDVIRRCPTGAIVWLDESGRGTRGEEAKSIHWSDPLPIG